MPRVAAPRQGETLTVKKRPLPFSYFPVTRGKRRAGLFDLLFAGKPWTVMRGAINDQTSGGDRDEALAFLGQAEDFYQSATGRLSANPLMTYYAFLNLGKALLRVLGFPGDLSKAQHGLSERHVGPGTDLSDFAVEVKRAYGGWTNVFAELVERLGYGRPAVATRYPVIELIPQVVVGHRLWREASHRTERFVPVEKIQILDDKAAKELWLRLYVSRGDLDRYGITHKRLLHEGQLASDFKEVDFSETGEDLTNDWICFEGQSTVSYTGRPTDVLMDVIKPMRPRLWRIITTGPEQGYRKYYVHLTPRTEQHRLPQIASLWVLMYYFGSVVRYRPHEFDTIVSERYGAFVSEFISAQSEQLLYMLASEMCRREVAKPAVI